MSVACLADGSLQEQNTVEDVRALLGRVDGDLFGIGVAACLDVDGDKSADAGFPGQQEKQAQQKEPNEEEDHHDGPRWRVGCR